MKKVRIYRNLNRKCLSVQTMTEKGWRVSKHVKSIKLKSAIFKVSEAGRQRVIREKRKNVHAYIEGYEIESFPEGVKPSKRISYNPYKSSHFFYADEPDRKPLSTFYAEIGENGIFA